MNNPSKIFLKIVILNKSLMYWPYIAAMSFGNRENYSRRSFVLGNCHKRQKPQAPTPQAPIRNPQTRKDANAKCFNRNTNFT